MSSFRDPLGPDLWRCKRRSSAYRASPRFTGVEGCPIGKSAPRRSLRAPAQLGRGAQRSRARARSGHSSSSSLMKPLTFTLLVWAVVGAPAMRKIALVVSKKPTSREPIDALLPVLTVVMKGAQMARTLHWESNLEGVLGVGMLLCWALAFLMMAH